MTEATVETKRVAKRINVVIDAVVRAEVPLGYYETLMWDQTTKSYREATVDERAERLQRRCDELLSFMRDHRSLDDVHLYVEKTRGDICSACKNEWEVSLDDGAAFCAWCGAEVEAGA
jgi:hypothetical protein